MGAKADNFYKHVVREYFQMLMNVFVYLPYLFSVMALLRTLFTPWKGLVSQKKVRGLNVSVMFENAVMSVLSRGIGVALRLCMILAYCIFQIFYILLLPILIVGNFLLMPLSFLYYLVMPTDTQREEYAKQHFLKTHLMQEENRAVVEQWFHNHYRIQEYKKQWWQLRNLFTSPPLARDWAMGYTPTLDSYTYDLTHGSYQNHRHVIIGRTKEVSHVEEILSKQEEANVLLVGEEGVGRHTIVDALAKRMFEGTAPKALAYKRVLKLNMEKILTRASDQKERERFLEQLFEEAARSHHVILVIDSFDKYVSYGEGRINLSGPIEMYAKTGQLQVIGITSPFLYQQHVFPNEKISHIFTKVDIAEISLGEALGILLEIHHTYEQRYHVLLPYESLREIVEKSAFFITDVPFPEKAMQVLDTACVYTAQKLRQKVVTPEIIDAVLSQRTHTPTTVTADLKDKLLNLEDILQQQVINQTSAVQEVASALRRSFLLLGKRKKPLATFLFLGPTGVGKTETAKAIAQHFFGSERTLQRFDMSLYQSKNDIPKLIGSMQNQDPGLLTQAIRQHPFGVLLLDEIEKAHPDLLNIFLTILDEGYYTDGFGKRVDCKNVVVVATSNAGAEYLYSKLSQSVSSTQPPSAGPLASTVQAQSSVQTVGSASVQSFSPSPQPIVPQQNNGAVSPVSVQPGGAGSVPPSSQPFSSPSTSPSPPQQGLQISSNELIAYLIEHRYFSPEFLNRFDGVVAYQPIQQDSMILIAKKMLNNVVQQIYQLHKVKVVVSDQTLHDVLSRNFNPAFGARNLDRILRTEIEDKVAQQILSNQAKQGDTITL